MLHIYNIIHVFGERCSDLSGCSLLGRTVACVIWMNVKLQAVLMAPADILLLGLMWLESRSEVLKSYPEFWAYGPVVVVSYYRICLLAYL